MRRLVAFVALAVLFPLAHVASAHAQPQEVSAVSVVKVDGSIDRTMQRYLRGAVADAEAVGAAMVIQLDSPGTLDGDPLGLAERIHDATVPVIVWVGPAPAKAQGGALLLLYAASAGAVAPGVGIGPLIPLDLSSPGPSADEVRRTASGWLAERGRGTDGVLFPDEPVPAQAAIDGHVASIAATSVTALLDELDGQTLATAGGDVTLRSHVATHEGEPTVSVRFVDLGPVARVLHAAASPTWIYVLLVFGLAALAFELTQPGFGFAGFSGVALVGLGVYGLTAVPFVWLGLALLLLGIGAMTADVLLRRLGVLTGVGLGAFVLGSYVVFSGISDRIDVSPWLIGSTALGALLYWGFGLTVALRSRDRITSTQQGLVGLLGEARGELKPDGPVFVKGTMWRGRTMDGPIASGTMVRVRGVDGLVLRVQPEAEPPPDD